MMKFFLLIIRKITCKIISLSLQYSSFLQRSKGKVYMLHSVGDDSHPYNISLDSFEVFLNYLKKTHVIPLGEWELENDFSCLTFDDVPSSFYYNAYPLLKKYNIPFTLFVSCSLLDKDMFITKDMLRELAEDELCTIGSHGWNHVFYSSLSNKEKDYELFESKYYLEQIIGRKVDIFAFPYGSLYACGLKRKKKVGNYYKYGFGTITCDITKPSFFPSYYLPRICVSDKLISLL